MQFIIFIIGGLCACWESKDKDSAKTEDTAQSDTAQDTAQDSGE